MVQDESFLPETYMPVLSWHDSYNQPVKRGMGDLMSLPGGNTTAYLGAAGLALAGFSMLSKGDKNSGLQGGALIAGAFWLYRYATKG